MAYAQVVDGQVVAFGLPNAARRLDTGQWVLGLPDASVAEQRACGWFLVDESAVKPADTATTWFRRTVEVVGGVPTVVWVETAKDADVVTRESRERNRSTLESQARTAYQQNQAWLTGGPFTQVGTLEQVRALTRQMNAVIRVLFAGDLLD